MRPWPCPTPWKIRWLNEAEARHQLRHTKATSPENKKLRKLLSVYPCGDHWHVGHDRGLTTGTLRQRNHARDARRAS